MTDAIEDMRPEQFKSLFGASMLVPSLLITGGLGIYKLAGGTLPHTLWTLVVIAACMVIVSVITATFTAWNLFPDMPRPSRAMILRWVLLPRTKRYIASRQRGEPVVLFSRAAVTKLRMLNRICMVLVTAFLAAATLSLVMNIFLPALEQSSTGSKEAALAMIGVVLLAFLGSRLIGLVVRHSAHTQMQATQERRQR